MALQLYRQGNSHTVRGVVCELKNFHQDELIDALGNGWFRNERDINGSLPEPEPPVMTAETIVSETDEAAFRAMAKELGIKSWHNKKIENLILEIKEFNA